MVEIKRTLRIVTHQEIIDQPLGEEGVPMRKWHIKLFLLDDHGEPKPAKVFQKAVYHLHPSFADPTQTFTVAPFTCENEGWGEFDMTIDLFTTEKGGKNVVAHDLNFQATDYVKEQEIKFKNPSAALLNLLRDTGPVGNDENGMRKKPEPEKKRKRASAVDMEKLADALQKLGEDDLLHVVQMIHDNKSDDTYTKNDVDQGEFHVDLYTLPETLLKMLWEYVQTTGS